MGGAPARAARRATACCVSTRWAAASMIDDYGVPGDRVHVVGMGHQPQPVDPAQRDWSRPRFLFVGRDRSTLGGVHGLGLMALPNRRAPDHRHAVVVDHRGRSPARAPRRSFGPPGGARLVRRPPLDLALGKRVAAHVGLGMGHVQGERPIVICGHWHTRRERRVRAHTGRCRARRAPQGAGRAAPQQPACASAPQVFAGAPRATAPRPCVYDRQRHAVTQHPRQAIRDRDDVQAGAAEPGERVGVPDQCASDRGHGLGYGKSDTPHVRLHPRRALASACVARRRSWRRRKARIRRVGARAPLYVGVREAEREGQPGQM